MPVLKGSGSPVVGLDIGSNYIKVVEARLGKDRAVVTALGVMPTPSDTVDNNVILDPVGLGAAIRKLLRPQVVGRPPEPDRIGPPHELEQQQILGLQDGIALELPHPMSVRSLPFQQAMARTFDRSGKRRTMAEIVPEAFGK